MNKVAIGKLNALSIYIAWFCLILCLIIIILSLAVSKAIFPYSIYSMMLLFASGVIHFILAFFVRCPHCSKCITVQGMAKIHSNSRIVYGIKGWGAVALQWFSGNVLCIHCGNEVDTNAL